MREDKAKVADSLLVPLQQANGKQAIRLLKPLRLGKRHRDMGQKAMPAVRLANGELAQTPAEALQRWREHFGQLEGGQVTTSTDLWHTVASSRLRRPTCFPGLSDIPTLLELEDQLRKVKAGKAVGPDLVPGEFLKAAGPWIARELWPLLLKICCRVQEPLMYKGGRLATLFKHKGSATEATNHRAILISSTVGKTIHGVFRDRTVPYVRKGASELQFSAHQGALVSIAAHTVRLHQNWSKVSRRCDFTIFVDIASAYYTLLRQLTTEVEMTDENILALLARLGYKDCHIDAVARKLKEPTAMESLEVPPHLRAILGEFHSHTWFRLRSDPALVSTGRGTRPGDGLADILWSLSFSNFLHLTEERIQSLNLHKPLRWNEQVGLQTSIGARHITGACITWADDLACVGTCSGPNDVIPQIRVIADLMFAELYAMGLQPNFQPGKTEAVVSLRGSQKVAVQQFLHGHCESTIELSPLFGDTPSRLRVVPHYTHLGGLISHSGKLKAEIRRRLGIARQSFHDLSPKVFSNPKVGLETRIAIFRATVWLSLTFNVGTWSELTSSEQKVWHCGVFRLYRLLLRRLFPPMVVRHFTEDEVLSLTSLPSPLVAIRVCRLRHFAQVLSRGTPFFWALVAEEGSWLRAVTEDFAWLYSQIEGLTCLPPPWEDSAAWHHLILTAQPRWKGLIKRVSEHSRMVDKISADVRTFHRKLLDLLFKAGLRHRFSHLQPDEPDADIATGHVCWICSKEFASFKAWGSHSFKAHGRTNACRHLQSGTTCDACGKMYPSNERLVRHLRTHAPCRQTVATMRQFVEAQPYYGSRVVRERLPTDSMKTWLPTSLPTVPAGDAWPMTSAMWTCLRLLSTVPWATLAPERIPDIHTCLCLRPVHYTEMVHLLDSLDSFYGGQATALQNLLTLRALVVSSFTPRGARPVQALKKPPLEWLDEVPHLYYVHCSGPPRMRARLLYVVHLFSGTKRQGDLHSHVAQLPAPDCGAFCPISVDVVLDGEKCNLLSPHQQHKWLTFAMQGALYMVVSGPPCETWSVSRLRFLETFQGPRPLRASSSDSSLWCQPPLRLKELRQLLVGNGLLIFSLLMVAAQTYKANLALLEHPSASATRYNRVPPSIWRLKALRLLLCHPNIELHYVLQGYYHGLSPKPTTLLISCPMAMRSLVQRIIDDGRSRGTLPPPIVMGRKDKSYSTAPLKRYPAPFCRMISALAFHLHDCAAPCDPHSSDPVHSWALHLETMYQQVTDNHEDGNDFYQGPHSN